MKKYRSRIAAVTAALIIAAGCLSGCGNNGNNASSAAETTTTAVSEETAGDTLPPAESKAPDESSEAPAPESAPDTGSVPDESSAADTAPEPDEQIYAPAMWKVTSPGGGVIYMMGSAHALKEESYPLPGYVQSAFDDCEVLAVEYDMTDINQTFAASLKYSDRMSYPAGETAKDHLSEETWAGLCSFLEHYGEDPAAYESMNLWYMYSALQNFSLRDTGLNGTQGFDMYLLNAAHEADKEIYNVESAEFQIGMFADLSDGVYDILLSQFSEENIENLNDSFISAYKCWRAGDVEGTNPENGLDVSNATEEEMVCADEFMNNVYYNRNKNMAKTAEELTDSGKKVLFVVGLGHFAGDRGIAALMKNDGYTVERVTEYP